MENGHKLIEYKNKLPQAHTLLDVVCEYAIEECSCQ